MLDVSSLMPMPPVVAGAVQFACSTCLDYIDISNYYDNTEWARAMGAFPYMSRSVTGERNASAWHVLKLHRVTFSRQLGASRRMRLIFANTYRQRCIIIIEKAAIASPDHA